jgi:hypothetical protein
LDPSLKRVFYWEGGLNPRISGVPILSPQDQPLYGLGAAGLKPLYIRSKEDEQRTCFLPENSPLITDFCFVSVRNVPYEEWNPAFVVWPTNSSQV